MASLALLTDLHHDILVKLSAATELPLQGISQGSRVLRWRLGPRLCRKIRDIEIACSYARHVTNERCQEFLDQLSRALSAHSAPSANRRAAAHPTAPTLPLARRWQRRREAAGAPALPDIEVYDISSDADEIGMGCNDEGVQSVSAACSVLGVKNTFVHFPPPSILPPRLVQSAPASVVDDAVNEKDASNDDAAAVVVNSAPASTTGDEQPNLSGSEAVETKSGSMPYHTFPSVGPALRPLPSTLQTRRLFAEISKEVEEICREQRDLREYLRGDLREYVRDLNAASSQEPRNGVT